jgi:hypothetical protein
MDRLGISDLIESMHLRALVFCAEHGAAVIHQGQTKKLQRTHSAFYVKL